MGWIALVLADNPIALLAAVIAPQICAIAARSPAVCAAFILSRTSVK